MKKLFIVFSLIVVSTLIANAQEYKKFKVGLSLGVALPPPDEYTDVISTLELMYRLSDDLALGFRLENVTREDFYSSETVSSSYTLNGQYYLSAHKFRPFLGAGFGLYEAPGENFGFYPRVGFDVGHFSMSMDYNVILLSDSIDPYFVRDDYFGIRIGFFIGGGKKLKLSGTTKNLISSL